MKKITLLFLLAILPLVGFTQTSPPWDFNNNDHGWAPNNGNTVATNNATFINLSFNSGNNPRFQNANVSVDADNLDNAVVALTIRNNDATGPTEFRFQYLKQGGGFKTEEIVISQNDSDFKTYYIDLTHAEWTGTITEIRFQFKNAGNVTFTGTGETLDIDSVEFLAAIPTTLQETYTFDTDGDTEGFSASSGVLSGPTSGILTFTPDADKFAKIEQILHHIDADVNKIVRIALKNNSTLNDQLRINGGGTTLTQPMLVSGAGGEVEKIYGFDMSAVAGWTGTQTFFIGIGSINGADGFDDEVGPDGIPANGDEANDDGKSIDAGTVEINSIVFNSTVLAVNRNELTNFTLYPNPVNGRLNFNSQTDISKIEVYNLTGQRLLQLKNFSNNNSFDVSTLSSGIYLVNVEDVENRTTTKKIIVSR